MKKCVLSFLRKLVRDEISLILDGSAFQARAPATEKALSVKWSRVRETAKLWCGLTAYYDAKGDHINYGLWGNSFWKALFTRKTGSNNAIFV